MSWSKSAKTMIGTAEEVTLNTASSHESYRVWPENAL
jgi:hypothetical protein